MLDARGGFAVWCPFRVVDDPRGALRGALTRLRSVIDDPERVRLYADANLVRLELADDELDVRALCRAAESGGVRCAGVPLTWSLLTYAVDVCAIGRIEADR